MMLATVKLATRQAPESVLGCLSQVRGYFAPLSVDFPADVAGGIKAAKPGPPLLGEWNSTKEATLHTMKLMQTYKDVGDLAGEPLLKFHNPRTFEDLSKPVPNFRKFNLKAGEVPKFFDNVLMKRADEAVREKSTWWDQRKKLVEEGVKEREFRNFPQLPVPDWSPAKGVSDQQLQGITDALYKSLEPKRKMKLPTLPAQVTDGLSSFAKSLGQDSALEELKTSVLKTLAERATVVEGDKVLSHFKILSKAEVEQQLQARRAEVHARWVKMWAKRIMTLPEQALVPLKERDQLLASTFSGMSTKYNDLVYLVGQGTETYGHKLAHCSETDNFFLRNDRDKIEAAFPPSEKELEAIALAKKLENRSYAIEQLLGPALVHEGSSQKLKSEEVVDLTAHLYTPDRYQYREGMKLAERYRQEEEELKDQLKAIYGNDIDIRPFQRQPRTVVQQLFEHGKEFALRAKGIQAKLEESKDDPYMTYALQKELDFHKDPSNITLEEVLYPEIVKEMFDIEMQELADKERQVDEAEEEELWLLTLQKQARHIHQHMQFDLPQAAMAYMDPILYKKLDWEVTYGRDILHLEVFQGADCDQGQYVKDMYGLENLSHHFLPLIRYRRKKSKQQLGFWPPEMTPVPATAKAVEQ